MITLATIDDLGHVAELGKWFYFKLNQEEGFDPKMFEAAWTQYLVTGYGLIVKRTVDNTIKEALGMLFYDDPNDGVKSAANAFWYVSDDESTLASGLVYERLEREVIQRGACRMFISNLFNSRYDRVAKFLSHVGYIPVEAHYRKDLCHKPS